MLSCFIQPQTHDEEPRLSSDPNQESVFGEGNIMVKALYSEMLLIIYLLITLQSYNENLLRFSNDICLGQLCQGF